MGNTRTLGSQSGSESLSRDDAPGELIRAPRDWSQLSIPRELYACSPNESIRVVRSPRDEHKGHLHRPGGGLRSELAHEIAAGASAQCPPDGEVDVLADGADRAVQQGGVDDPDVMAARGHGRVTGLARVTVLPLLPTVVVALLVRHSGHDAQLCWLSLVWRHR